MTKISFLILLFLGLKAMAQEIPLAVPPAPPFVKNAASHAAWTIAYSYDKGVAGASAGGAVTPSEARVNRKLIKVQVVKADSNRHETSSWSDGTTSETWTYKNWILISSPDFTEVIVMDRFHMNQNFAKNFPEYSKSDFPSLDWLSLGTFIGVKTIQKRACYVFKRLGVSPDQASNPTATQDTREIVASIDGVTGLPAEIDDGTIHQTFSYQGEIPVVLELPPRFAAALEHYLKIIREPYSHTMK